VFVKPLKFPITLVTPCPLCIIIILFVLFLLLLNVVIENLILSFGSVAGGRSVSLFHPVLCSVVLPSSECVLGQALCLLGRTVNYGNRTREIKVALSICVSRRGVKADGACS
jgi:hypothetical protein